MITDKYGQQIYTENDLCDLYLANTQLKLNATLVSEKINLDVLDLVNTPQLIHYQTTDQSLEDFDSELKTNWYMPDEYKELDIAKFVLDQCKNEAELQRAGAELLLYQERDLFMLLRYLKYFVDTMRNNGIVWGVGRGSSVSSFVLYLIGLHRINSLFYQLDIEEFLK